MLYDWDATEVVGFSAITHEVRRQGRSENVTLRAESVEWHQGPYENIGGAQMEARDYFRTFSSYKLDNAPSHMEDVVSSVNDGDVANQLDGYDWGLEEIVGLADEYSRETREVLNYLRVKIRSAGITVQGTTVEIIALASEGLDIRESSPTAELARLRNNLDRVWRHWRMK